MFLFSDGKCCPTHEPKILFKVRITHVVNNVELTLLGNEYEFEGTLLSIPLPLPFGRNVYTSPVKFEWGKEDVLTVSKLNCLLECLFEEASPVIKPSPLLLNHTSNESEVEEEEESDISEELSEQGEENELSDEEDEISDDDLDDSCVED